MSPNREHAAVLDDLPLATFVIKSDKIENIRRFFVILFVYIEKILYFCGGFV